MKKIGKLQEKLEYYDVYSCENILLRIVTGMNIDSDLLDMKLCNLSGGQLQRVLLSMAIMDKPKLLLLDEPAAGMNPNETIELMEIIIAGIRSRQEGGRRVMLDEIRKEVEE